MCHCHNVTHIGLRDEEESGCGASDGFYVFLVVAAEVTCQQVVEDAHDAHQEEEEDDSFSKQEAWGAVIYFEKIVKGMPVNTHTKHPVGRLCLFTFGWFVPCIQQSTSA